MATTTKKSATAKKPAAKKPAAKATAKKPAAKKAAPAKKPAAKKPAAKATVKKPAAKKAAPAKKPAAKAAAKKPAAKKAAPAKKPAAKAAVKKAAPVKKPAAPVKAAPAVKKAAPVKKPAAVDPNVKVLNLFDAYAKEKLPKDHGYIVSSFFKETSAYSIYEIVSYSGVKEITYLGNGLQFTTNSKKLYVLVEPGSYNEKHLEPVHRKEGEKIPYRYSELEILTASDQTKIMVAKDPMEVPSSFTILEPSGINFSVVFYSLPDIYQSLVAFFKYSLNQERRIPQRDAEKAAEAIVKTVENTMGFKGEYS